MVDSLGLELVQQTCLCGKVVDERGLHGLSCRMSAARYQRHSHLNDIIWRAIKKAQTSAVKEPVGLSCDDSKRLDRATLIPWTREKAVAWEVTVVDTFAQSHIGDTSSLAGAAANHAATLKTSKYTSITDTNIFVPIAIKTGGAWELGKRISAVIKELKEIQYLFQQLSITIQRDNAVSFLSTFSLE